MLPIDDRRYERINPDLAGRPQLVRGQQPAAVRRHAASPRTSVLTLKNKSHSVTAEVTVPASGAEGVLITQGGRRRRLEPVRQGRQAEVLLQLLRHPALLRRIRRRAIPAGKHQLRMEFKYDGGGVAKGGDVTLYFDGKAVGQGPRRAHHPDGLLRRRGVRRRPRHRLTDLPDYGPPATPSTATSPGSQLDLGGDDQDHLVSPEERFRLAMAHQ